MWLCEAGSWLQFREVFPVSELATRYPPRHKLKCNIREVQAGQWQFQATAVWVEGKAPLEYRTKDWYEDLQRAASCYKNKATSHINLKVVNLKSVILLLNLTLAVV